MKIKVIVTSNSRHHEGVELVDGVYHVRVKERAVEGRANARVIELLAKHFSVQKRAVQIVHGKTSKWKFVEISNVAA